MQKFCKSGIRKLRERMRFNYQHLQLYEIAKSHKQIRRQGKLLHGEIALANRGTKIFGEKKKHTNCMVLRQEK